MKLSALLPLTALGLIAGCGGGSSDTIARVNNQEVSKETYLKTLETMDTVVVLDPNTGRAVQARLATPLSAQALNRLVEQSITIQTAKDEGVVPSDEDVDKELQMQQQRDPEFVDKLKQVGYTMDEIKRQIKFELAQYRLQTRGAPEKTIKDAEDYVKENPKEFEIPPQASFRIIVVDTEAKKKDVDKAMLSGLTFGATAAKYSTLPTAKTDNGAYPPGGGPTPRPVPINEGLSEPLRSQVEGTAQGRTTEWFKVGEAWVKVLVESKTPRQPRPLTKVELEMLRRNLTLREMLGNNEVRMQLLRNVIKADLKITPPYLRQSWERQKTQLQEQMNALENQTGSAAAGAPDSAAGTQD